MIRRIWSALAAILVWLWRCAEIVAILASVLVAVAWMRLRAWMRPRPPVAVPAPPEVHDAESAAARLRWEGFLDDQFALRRARVAQARAELADTDPDIDARGEDTQP